MSQTISKQCNNLSIHFDADKAYFEIQTESSAYPTYIVGFPFATAPTRNTIGPFTFNYFTNSKLFTSLAFVDKAIFAHPSGK